MANKGSFKKGDPRAGRRRGAKNAVTKDVRAGFKALVEGSVAELQGWLKRVARRDPARALQIVAGMAEYIVPKLSRTELSTGSDTLKIEITDPTRRDGKAA